MILMFIYESMAIWGGLERIWTDRMNYMVRVYGIDVYLITTIQGSHPLPYMLDSRVHVKDLGIQFHYAYRYRGLRRIFEKYFRHRIFERRLAEEIINIQPDIISCAAARYVPTLMKLKGEIPLIAEAHENCLTTYYSQSMKIVQFLMKKALFNSLRKVDIIVALTDGDKKDWVKYNSNTIVIPNIVHLNDSKKYSDNMGKNIIFVGRFTDQKGLPSLLKIWMSVFRKHPDWTLSIYGEGPLGMWLENEVSLRYNGISIYAPTPDIMQKYIGSSILMSTSNHEPFGLVIPEAMSCGLPVVAFDCPYGPGSIITDGEDGFLIKISDCESFANKICYLIEHPEERKRMGRNAIISSQRYRPENIMPQWIELYKSIKNGI